MDKKITTIGESIDEVFNAYFNEKAKPEQNNSYKPKNKPNSDFKAKDK